MCLLRGTDWVFIYNSTFCPHSVFMCFVWIWEQTATISVYSINLPVYKTEAESVYCAVRAGSLNQTDTVSFLEGLNTIRCAVRACSTCRLYCQLRYTNGPHTFLYPLSLTVYNLSSWLAASLDKVQKNKYALLRRIRLLWNKFNPLALNDLYIRRTAQLTSRRCILNIYSTNLLTEYFKHAARCPFFFPSRCSSFYNAIFFGSCNIHILSTGCAKILKKILAPKC